MAEQPLVTAIITVFNSEAYIERAVKSILIQSLSDIEIIVVNDGSTDTTAEVLEAITDERLTVIHLPRTGRAASLALACREAKGRYIANLDADDVCYPSRFEKQAEFLESNPEYAWVGSGEEQEDSRRNEHLKRIYPLSNESIRRQSAKCIPYCHSAVMFRKSLIDEGINYDSKQPYLIDFEYFLRVAERYKVANLPDILVKRYVSGESFFQSQFKSSVQNRALARLSVSAVRRLDLPRWNYIFPLARYGYLLVPNRLKKLVRRLLGLREQFS